MVDFNYNVIPESVTEALDRWDRGEPVWTAEMGGLGPGYEQVVQILAFEIMRGFVGGKPLGEMSIIEKEKLRDQSIAAEAARLLPSGAQVWAATGLAIRALDVGYRAALQELPAPRLIQARKWFPGGQDDRDRDARQAVVATWVRRAFGEAQATSVPQRALRFLEEALETYQAARGERGMAQLLVDFVFRRPVGDLSQELGGVGVTVLALAAAAGVSADKCENAEVARVLSKPFDHFAARNEEKNKAGFDVTDTLGAPALTELVHLLNEQRKEADFRCPLCGTAKGNDQHGDGCTLAKALRP